MQKQFVVYVSIRNDPVDIYIRKDILIISAISAEDARDQIRSECLSLIKEKCTGRDYSPNVHLEIVVKPLGSNFKMEADTDNLDTGSIGLFEVIDPERSFDVSF
jgi:hypothetical protein